MKILGDKRRASRARLPSREELALWRHATADVKPRANMALPTEEEAPSDGGAAPQRGEKASTAQPEPAILARDIRPQVVPAFSPLAPLDRRLKRRLSSGKSEVDDVIDLHGLTQAQAHQALSAFLWRAAGAGARIVLVITGKGGWRNSGDPHSDEAGVLRRQAPHWLRAPSLRAIVLSVEEAGRPHGGSGALYVRLRRRFRADPVP